jgi:LysM repeat protein
MIRTSGQDMVRSILANALALGMLLSGPSLALADGRYVVRPGDTLSAIALKFGVSLGTLAEANGIYDWDYIEAGRELVIPQRQDVHRYTVKTGDYLMGIASSFGIHLSELLRYNPQVVDADVIYPGQVLLIPVHSGGGYAPASGSDFVRQTIDQYAAAYGIDPQLVEALAWQESGWQQHVVSPAGAVGVMQIMPDTGHWLASDVLGRPLDVHGSVTDNVLAGVAYLRWLLDRTGDISQALAGYYQGLGSLHRYGPFEDTRAFVHNVMAIYNILLLTGRPPGP